MEPDDREQPEVCSLCGAALLETAPAFAFGTENVLCAACSTSRGGRYDEERDVWAVPPDLSGLDDEAYGAAPHERRGH
jgi:hypothetical protein